jgi:uncharacterized protein YycO
MIIVRFVRGNSIPARAIQMFTWGYWNHVELYTKTGYLGAQPEGGYQIRPYNYTKFDKEIFRGIELDAAKEANFWQWQYAQIGKPYDWTAILGLVAHRDWQEDDQWFCSEAVAAGFEQINEPILNEYHSQSYKITPRDIALSTRLIDVAKPEGT